MRKYITNVTFPLKVNRANVYLLEYNVPTSIMYPTSFPMTSTEGCSVMGWVECLGTMGLRSTDLSLLRYLQLQVPLGSIVSNNKLRVACILKTGV